jgi:hypothetical protein
MFVLATGTFTDPSKLGPYLDGEIAQIHANHDKGLIVSQYLRADGKGVFVVWQVGSIDEARKHASAWGNHRRSRSRPSLLLSGRLVERAVEIDRDGLQ